MDVIDKKILNVLRSKLMTPNEKMMKAIDLEAEKTAREIGMKIEIDLPPDLAGWLIDYKILGTDEDITPEEKALLLLRSALTPEPDISDDKIPQ